MKIDRLIGIILVLLQKDKVTAPYLAERFEVSRRTINRDIEDICKAGVPVVTLQGSNGGISIAAGYKIDRRFFTARELDAVLAGLQGLDSVSQDKKYKNIIDKFLAGKETVAGSGHIAIDLSSHYKNTLAPKINMIQQGIDCGTRIQFTYFSRSGEQQLMLEPYLIVFQWSSWYVFGFSPKHGQFRLFKLNRLWNLQNTAESYEPREIPTNTPDFSAFFTDDINAVVSFHQSVKYRLIEEYGTECYRETEDGRLLFAFPFTSKEYLLTWVLSFGDKAELLAPKDLRTEIKNRLKHSLELYWEP